MIKDFTEDKDKKDEPVLFIARIAIGVCVGIWIAKIFELLGLLVFYTLIKLFS